MELNSKNIKNSKHKQKRPKKLGLISLELKTASVLFTKQFKAFHLECPSFGTESKFISTLTDISSYHYHGKHSSPEKCLCGQNTVYYLRVDFPCCIIFMCLRM